MRAAALVALLVVATAAPGQTLTVFRETGDTMFRVAADARDDAQAARTSFGLAAKLYDDAFDGWEPSHRSPAVALMRGRAHFLAGDLPQAIRAFRDGLALAPWDADLQRGLAV